VSNALAAAAVAWGRGLAPETIAARLAGAPQVPGRMERLVSAGFTVLRDFAHTPDALRRALRTLRPLTTGRLIVLFGCGGDRDRRKRPVMGEIAAQDADFAVVTSDNPRSEDPERIIDDIEAGMGAVAHLRIADRRAAIHRALQLLQAGDCLLLAGKGHETYQVVGSTPLPFDELVIVRDALASACR
jgi:UDP-N-acetylmuramoyl-L-alanyl-D-glutamate--2,6-diaminopimelate ligase